MRPLPVLAIPILAILAAADATAFAQDKPATSPTRDVDVSYRALAGGAEVRQRSRFDVEDGRIRIDTPSPGLYVLVDRRAHRMDMVSEGDRSVLEMRYDPARTVAGIPPDRAFLRLGADTVAGTPCTEWRSQDKAGGDVAFCITADGVLLRARSGANVLLEATRVTYGPIPGAIFAIPAGYQRRDTTAR